MSRESQRGGALIVTMLLMLAITAVSVGIIRYASREVAGAHAGRKQTALVACAEAGRQMLLSQFHAMGARPTEIVPMGVPLDAAGNTRVAGGHVDSATGPQVTRLHAGTLPRAPQGDISNVIAGSGAGAGAPMMITVHCNDNGRQLEVDYGVNFGL